MKKEGKRKEKKARFLLDQLPFQCYLHRESSHDIDTKMTWKTFAAAAAALLEGKYNFMVLAKQTFSVTQQRSPKSISGVE